MTRETAAKLLEENLKTIFAYAVRRMDRREDAEDVAQEIVLAFLASCDRIRDERAVFSYLWTIAANTVKRAQMGETKKNRHTADADDAFFTSLADPDGDFTRDDVDRERIHALRRELALLSHEYRVCTVAYYFENKSCREIAAQEGISVEMVKYYLYKTRQILKEGIMTDRTFGDYSFRPAPFQFVTIFSGSYNTEYRNLFDRKIAGSILYAAYYTPMTAGELAIELGVATVYLEDELALLKKYDLITEKNGKYQTKLIIFTEEHDREMCRAAEEQLTDTMREILSSARAKLSRVRVLGFPGCGKDDDTLMWNFFFELIRRGPSGREEDYPTEIYDGAKGVNYGVTFEREADSPYGCNAFAGYYGLGDGVAASFANFGVLGERHFWDAPHNWSTLHGRIAESKNGGDDAPLVYLSRAEYATVFERIFADEVAAMTALYERLHAIAADGLKNHAPQSVHGMIDAVLTPSLFFRTVGLMAKIAHDTGVMPIPDGDAPISGFLYEVEEPVEIHDCC